MKIAILILLLSSAADVGSTMRARQRLGSDFRELNPILRPVVMAGPAAHGAVSLLIDAGLVWRAVRCERRDGHGCMVPMVVGAAAHGWAAVHNEGLRAQPVSTQARISNTAQPSR